MIDERKIRKERDKLEDQLEENLAKYPEGRIQWWVHRVETLNWVLGEWQDE